MVQLVDVVHTMAASGNACRLPGRMLHLCWEWGWTAWIAIQAGGTSLQGGA